MRPWLWTVILLTACAGDSGGDKTTESPTVDGDDDDDATGDDDDDGGDDDDDVGDDDDDDTTPYSHFECEVLVANDLPDVYGLQARDDEYCESQPLYDPNIPTASVHWFSELTIDDCGNVEGTEVGVMYFNDAANDDLGAEDCMVWWIVEGVVDAGQGGADFGLDVVLERDLGETDCPFDPYLSKDFVGPAHYNVHVDGNTARFFFDGDTEPFAEGYANDSHFSWFFDSCPLL